MTAALLVLIAVWGLGVAPHAPAAATGARIAVSPGGAGPCSSLVPSSGIQGTVVAEGGPLATAGVTGLVLEFTYALSYSTVGPNGPGPPTGCTSATGNATVGSNGTFQLTPPLPPPTCQDQNGAQVCVTYTGAYLPVGTTVAGGAPVGYGVGVAGSPSSLVVTLTYELASVSIRPAGPTVVVSTGAPAAFSASPRSANGSSSPLTVTYAWTLNGTGWLIGGPTTAPTVVLSAIPGASVAELSVRVSAVVGGHALPSVSASVSIGAITTLVVSGEVNRTSLDVGGSVGVRLVASGATGYNYTAFVQPGLGLPEVEAACASVPSGETGVLLTCATNLTYPTAGTAQPTANVTNGYSSADWWFPQVTVHPAPALEVFPAVPVGYVGVPIEITVLAVNGSGTPPYAQACLQAPTDSVVCTTSPGPSWTFDPTFSTPGNFTAAAWAIDADGANVSLPILVEVAAPLAVGPITGSGANATVGAPVTLRAPVFGGALPARYWWNVSGGSEPLGEGVLPADGTVGVSFVPTAPGPLVVTLAVLDRFGTVASAAGLVSVGPASADRIAVVMPPPAAAVTAGDPVPLAWGAFDLSGAINPSFEAALEVNLSAGGRPVQAWVNASGVGPLTAVANGSYGVPASAWVEGVLNLTVTIGVAGEVVVTLGGGGLAAGATPVSMVIQPDRGHVRLFAPSSVHPGARSNATFWHTEDRFGNAVPGALLAIDLAFGGQRTDLVVASIRLADGESGVWINYSAPTSGGGEVAVVDGAGVIVLGPLWVPPAPGASAPNPAIDALAAAVPVGGMGTVAFAVARRRRKIRAAAPVEDELRLLAEGRARTVELIGTAGAVDLAGLERAWGGPAPPALADWLASLVADGTLRATLGEDGRARFCLADTTIEAPTVTLDPEALDRSLRQRDASLDERGTDDGPT